MRIKLLMSLSILLLASSPWALAQIKSDINGSDPGASELRAKKIFERLAGVKVAIDDPVIKKMSTLISQGNELAAAQLATENSNFYNVTVKVMALALSTREESVKTPFNDFAAGFIGVTRDNRDARELLTGNFYYRANESALQKNNLIPDILRSNAHYAELETRRVDLSKALYRVEGQELYKNLTETVPNPDPAGLLTSRTFIAEHATGGTNRRLVEFAFREFMCVPLSEWADSGAQTLISAEISIAFRVAITNSTSLRARAVTRLWMDFEARLLGGTPTEMLAKTLKLHQLLGKLITTLSMPMATESFVR